MLLLILLLQTQTPPPVAIVDAQIVLTPERTLDRATILLRDGRIEAVGPGLPVPPDAKVIPGAGLVVYPGFLDAHSRLGLPATKRTDEQRRLAESDAVDFTRGALEGMESANRKGIRPELGSLEPGKSASVIVTTGDPLEIVTDVVWMFIDGEPQPLDSKHTQLYEKFRKRPKPEPARER